MHRVALAERPAPPDDDPAWWRRAVIYQIYPRSFADGDGDGIGDLAGARRHLGYLAELGVDAIWFTPWYASPLADGGYDVADYRAIHPELGTLAEAEALIAEALALGIRTIVDIVPNHVSREHAWFRAALAAEPGSPERARFWFRDGAGPDGSVMPTAWTSPFAGPTWSRETRPDGTPGQWYLHLFSADQPDLDWDHPDVRREHEDVLRFWFDRGVGGVRIDSAALLVKDRALPEVPDAPGPGEHPHQDRDDLHDIYRGWRAVADSYPGTRVLVGELWLPDTERFVAYLRPDEMHTAFNFDFLARPWARDELRASIAQTLAAHAPVGAPSTWVLSNHDVTRPVTRYGRADSSFAFARKRTGVPTDLALGTHRARAAALLTAALPGSLYLYQGDELGLPEVEDLPERLRRDPMHERSGGVDPGREGCRVPLPWSGDAPPFGFSPEGARAEPWLPQPADWRSLTVEAQLADPDSLLQLYRAALARRRDDADLVGDDLHWLDLGPELLAFRRGRAFACLTNFARVPQPLPAGELLLASERLVDGELPPDSTAWIRLADPALAEP
ncbi:MAG: glycoside hydrolase family 13 protein [Actinomycetales bacterium]|nr:glycoside hydrolase family 13 protein [Actinomycetales bacterium]